MRPILPAILLALGLALVLVTATIAPVAAQDWQPVTLANGGFEAGPPGEGLAEGWFIPQGPYKGETSVSDEAAHGGRWALRIRDDEEKAGMAVRHDRLPARPGAKCRATAWVLCESGRARLYLEFFSAGGGRTFDKWAEGGEPAKWTQLSVEGEAPLGTRTVSLIAYSTVGNVGLAYFDDFMLEMVPPAEGGPGKPAGPVDVGARRQLLFDDWLTARREKVEIVVTPPRKTGRVFLRADRPWERLLVNAWHTIMQDPDPLDPAYRYRLWYEAYAGMGDLGSMLAYARSRDGLEWEKPNLGLVEFEGSKENNLVFRGALGHGQHGGTVFVDPTAPPEERYRYFYLGGKGVCGAVSPDGLHWAPVAEDNDTLVQWGSDTQNTCFWDPDRQAYVAFLRSWSPRMVSRTESKDFRTFPDPVLVLAPDELDPPDSDLYNNAAIKYPYAANAYFIFTSLYHHPSDKLWVELAVSRDSVEWERPSREPFIPNGPEGEWDSGVLYRGVGLLRMGDELWLSYYGRVATHNTYGDKEYQGGYSFAVSRLDGFASMNAGEELGELVTVPLVFSGKRLVLNLEVLRGGGAKVELQDEAGKPLPGFTQADCDQMVCDDVSRVVTWRGKSDLSALAGKPVRLRFVLRRCKLYAFECGQ